MLPNFQKVVKRNERTSRKPYESFEYFKLSIFDKLSVISVFVGKECFEIYYSWDFPSLLIELILGIVVLLSAFAISFVLTRYTDKKEAEMKARNEEKMDV